MQFTQATVDAKERLQEEYKSWLKVHPEDFCVELKKNEDGSLDYFTWQCSIPGKAKTPWEGGVYKLKMVFPADYPYSPPRCSFCPLILHPNVFPSGAVSLSLIKKGSGWRPQTTAKEVLLGIQLLLDDANFQEPAQAEAFVVYSQSRIEYEDRIRKQASEMSAVS